MHIRPATIRSRSLALAVDLGIIILYAGCLLSVTLSFYYFVLGRTPDVLGSFGVNGAHLLGFTVLTLPVGLYFFLTEAGHRHASVGKRVARITVASTSGKSVSKGQILVRTIVKLLPWEFAHTFIYEVVYYSSHGRTTPAWVLAGLCMANAFPLLYILTVLIRKDHRGPHDLAACTIVTARSSHASPAIL